jgi:hypothetical protein
MAKQSAIDKRILELMAEIKEREIAIDVLESVRTPAKKAQKRAKGPRAVESKIEVQP